MSFAIVIHNYNIVYSDVHQLLKYYSLIHLCAHMTKIHNAQDIYIST